MALRCLRLRGLDCFTTLDPLARNRVGALARLGALCCLGLPDSFSLDLCPDRRGFLLRFLFLGLLLLLEDGRELLTWGWREEGQGEGYIYCSEGDGVIYMVVRWRRDGVKA